VLAMRDEMDDQGMWVWWIAHTFYQTFWVLRRVQDYLLDFCDAPELMKEVLEITERSIGGLCRRLTSPVVRS
jgi:hypothetical protein